ncbi:MULTISPECIES: amidohydrolase family protein [Microbulbifer]|uniref:amidohydrolase family protein n=1 Tax=Microbulbifer TaxID=48073 RepID=UPI000A87D431|nr:MULTISPECIES: amidohydrolase family protein [Microbulbifer]
MTKSLLAAAAAALISCGAIAKTTIIHAGQLLAVPGEKPLTERSIFIEDGVITDVREGYVQEGTASVIDLRDSFVMPGLMDMHVHLQGELGPGNDSDALKMSKPLMQMRSLMFAMRTLRAGFTTVRDVGSSPQEMYAMRDAINNGWIDGPRIIAAGGVGITGGMPTSVASAPS